MFGFILHSSKEKRKERKTFFFPLKINTHENIHFLLVTFLPSKKSFFLPTEQATIVLFFFSSPQSVVEEVNFVFKMRRFLTTIFVVFLTIKIENISSDFRPPAVPLIVFSPHVSG